jgi:hypothetical protein
MGRNGCVGRGIWGLVLGLALGLPASAQDVTEVREAGVLRHLGIPYANFITGLGDGLDVELVRGFARHLGLEYRFVETDWTRVFGDLTGRHARQTGMGAERLEETPIRGDLAANGMTVLPWREEVVRFSDPTFPSGVWLVARADSGLKPIEPTGDIHRDIARVKAAMDGVTVLALPNTCLDPGLYGLSETGARVRLQPPERKLNEMVPAILKNDAEATLLDVPDALVALERWPGQIKVIGPVSGEQRMAAAFRPDAPRLREAFNTYLAQVRADGTYSRLVEAYYPAVFRYFSEFFEARPGG